MAKYPRNNQSFVPGELLRVFKQFSNVEKEENDIVRASGHYFGSDNEGELIKCIKSFLNRLIDELDTCFPIFQRLLQEKLFTIESEGKKKSVNYKIGRKLPENVARFTDLNSKSLDIKSP